MFIPLHDANSLETHQASICDLRPDRRQRHGLPADRGSAAKPSPPPRCWGSATSPRTISTSLERPPRIDVRPGDADLRHLRLPAQRHLPPRRQHAVPVGVRRQCRGRARPFSLPRLLSGVRHRRRLRARDDGAGIAGAADRRVGRHRRRRRCLPDPAPAREDMDPGLRPHPAARAGLRRACACGSPSSS